MAMSVHRLRLLARLGNDFHLERSHRSAIRTKTAQIARGSVRLLQHLLPSTEAAVDRFQYDTPARQTVGNLITRNHRWARASGMEAGSHQISRCLWREKKRFEQLIPASSFAATAVWQFFILC